MTALSPTARVVAQMLADRRGAPMKIGEITDALGVGTFRRSVEEACQELALAGWPLVSDGDGVALTDDPQVVRAAADALFKRVLHQYKRVRALRSTANRMAQPMTLWESVA